MVLIKDGEEVQTKNFNSVKEIKYSPDGTTVAIVAESPDRKKYVLVNGVESNLYHEISDVTFSPD